MVVSSNHKKCRPGANTGAVDCKRSRWIVERPCLRALNEIMELLDDRRGQTIGVRFRKPSAASGQVRFPNRGSKAIEHHDAAFEQASSAAFRSITFVAPGRSKAMLCRILK
jgi:uncharacterized membrane protein